MSIKTAHKFVSQKPDSVDDTIIRPSNWNDNHVITLLSGKLMGRQSPGEGPVEEINISQFATEANAIIRQNAALDAASAAQNTANAALPKVGGNLTGPLVIGFNSPYFDIVYGGVIRWRVIIDNSRNFIFRDGDTGDNKIYFGSEGSIYSKQMGDLYTFIRAQALEFANNRVAAMAIRRTGQSYVNQGGGYVTPDGAVVTGYNRGGTNSGDMAGVYFHYLQMYDPVRGWVAMQG